MQGRKDCKGKINTCFCTVQGTGWGRAVGNLGEMRHMDAKLCWTWVTWSCDTQPRPRGSTLRVSWVTFIKRDRCSSCLQCLHLLQQHFHTELGPELGRWLSVWNSCHTITRIQTGSLAVLQTSRMAPLTCPLQLGRWRQLSPCSSLSNCPSQIHYSTSFSETQSKLNVEGNPEEIPNLDLWFPQAHSHTSTHMYMHTHPY